MLLMLDDTGLVIKKHGTVAYCYFLSGGTIA